MSEPVCPYCRCAVAEDELKMCPGCGTPHHADCFAENGGCTIFGCTAAPEPEPKVAITAPELAAAPVMADEHVPVMRTRTPPPPKPTPALPELPLFSSLGYGPAMPVRPVVSAGSYASPMRIDVGSMQAMQSAKNRTAYVLLGVFLGALGVHSFYAGYVKRGLLQLGLTVLTLGVGGLLSWIWAVVDIATITCDSEGRTFSI